MTTIVRFRAATGDYALPVESVTEVRFAAELTPLPTPQADVAGVMARGDHVLTVLSVLGHDGRHVLVVEHEGVTFGLLVDEVTGIHRVDDDLIGPPPHGQDREAVGGVIVDGEGIVLLLHPGALQSRLLP